jgi:sec-independent protein translocase protein TatA
VLLFGRGKISDLMGDVAKGIKSFKKGMAEDEPPAPMRVGQAQGEAQPAKTEDAKH